MKEILLAKGHRDVLIFLGSRWREDDVRMERIVTVTGFDVKKGKLQLNGRTWASPTRFGKSGGYKQLTA